MAKLFVADKSNLVLIARRVDQLKTLAESVRAEHGIRTTVVASDLSDPKAPEQIVG